MRFRTHSPPQPALEQVQRLERRLRELYHSWPDRGINREQAASLREQLAHAWERRRREIARINNLGLEAVPMPQPTHSRRRPRIRRTAA